MLIWCLRKNANKSEKTKEPLNHPRAAESQSIQRTHTRQKEIFMVHSGMVYSFINFDVLMFYLV